MATLTEYVGSFEDYQNAGTTYKRAMSFQVSAKANVNQIQILGSRGASASGTFQVRISSGALPEATAVLYTGPSLTTTTVLSVYNAGTQVWNTINLGSNVPVEPGVQYWLELRALTGSTNDEIRWWCDTTSPSYSLGAFADDYPTPGTWWIEAGLDLNFRIEGDFIVPSSRLTLLGVT